MINPYISLLKQDSSKAFWAAFVSVAIFTSIYFLIMRESFIFVLLVFIVSSLYIMGFLDSLNKKLKLYLTFPATPKQLVAAVFVTTFRTMTIFLLFILPFYLLASSFDEVNTPVREHIVLYVATIGNSLLVMSAFIWLFFELQERSYTTLAQFAALLIVTFLTFTIFTTLERLDVYFVVQIAIYIVLYVILIVCIYKRASVIISKQNVVRCS